MLAQQLSNGIATGLCYAVLAAGMSLTYRSSRVVNFAHGDLFVLAAFVCLSLQKHLGMPYLIAAIASVMVATGVSGAVGFAIGKKIRSGLAQSIATIAISLGLRDAMLIGFGSDSASFPKLYPDGVVSIAHATLPLAAVFIAIGLTIAVIGFRFTMENSRWGLWMRASAVNPVLASSVGISVLGMSILAFCISGALGAIAAVMVGPVWQINYALGGTIGVKAFAAAVIGGFGDLRGAIFGGIALGLAEALFAGYVSSAWTDVAVYGLLLLTLTAIPRGIMSLAARRVA